MILIAGLVILDTCFDQVFLAVVQLVELGPFFLIWCCGQAHCSCSLVQKPVINGVWVCVWGE